MVKIKRIMVPVDYSEHAAYVLRYACDLAQQFGAALDVVHIWDRPTYVPDTIVVGKPGEKPRSLVDLIRDNAENEMSEFLQECKLPSPVSVTHHLEGGEPASTILRTAERTGADMLVLGTHGRTGVAHLLLGSVAEKVVRMSPIPVLIVRPPA